MRGHRYTVKRRFIIIPVVVLLLLAAFFLVRHYFFPKPTSEVITVQVEQGDSTSRIAQKLHDAGVVTSSLLFRTLAWVEGRGRDFQAGTYSMHVGMHYGEVFSLLEKGPQAAGRLTVPEGFSLRQIAERVGQDTFISQDAFLEAASGRFSSAYLPEDNETNLEGFLFPKTYDLAAGEDASSLIQQMLAQFDEEAAGLDWFQAEKLGVSKYQIVVAASIIEREARLDSERPLIAAVIYNRMAAKMMLQMDATVQYALAQLPGQPPWKQNITYDDLKVESPYNTYLNFGLPPGPICNPGLASLQAALNPAQVDYLYYVATGTDGSHFFTKSYDEFLRVKNQQP